MNGYYDLTDEQKVKELETRDKEIRFLKDETDRRFPAEINFLKDEIEAMNKKLKGKDEEIDSHLCDIEALNLEVMQIRTLLKYSKVDLDNEDREDKKPKLSVYRCEVTSTVTRESRVRAYNKTDAYDLTMGMLGTTISTVLDPVEVTKTDEDPSWDAKRTESKRSEFVNEHIVYNEDKGE